VASGESVLSPSEVTHVLFETGDGLNPA
jgi:hypothetical protein